jgi:hypothetical protein
MPDAVTNAEVEDVLSSIRRLVSEDKRVPAEEKPKASTDRLVLTPALRVAELPSAQDSALQAAQDDADADVRDETESDVADMLALDDDVEYEDDADTVIGALMAETQDTPTEIDNLVGESQATVDLAGFEADRTDDDDASDKVDVDDNNITPAEDENSYDAELASGRSLHDVFRAVDAQEADDARKASVLRGVPDYRGPSATSETTQSLSAKIAVLEEVIARTDDQWEPDGAGRDDYAGTEPPAMAWEDAAEDTAPEDDATVAPEATLFTGQSATRKEAAADVFSGDEDVLDEEALRDLVSDIVRQELQGALGERITRNVRKLVRREIHRALAAQELE